jgi:hypothetical protein
VKTPLLFPILIAVSMLPAIQEVFAQQTFDPQVNKSSVPAMRTVNAIAIDGILNEVEWMTCDSISNFIQVEPYQGSAAKNRTVVKILFSDKYLYVGVYCYDSLGKAAIRVPDLKRDFEWRAHDTFAICIDGFHDKRNSVSFATNTYGAQKDYLSFDALLFDSDWNGLWKVRTSTTNAGWFAEFQIPWKTLRYTKVTDGTQLWGINFLRLRRATNEISVWSPYPRSFSFNRMEYAGELTQIQPPSPTMNIQANPYSLVSVNQFQNGFGSTENTYKYKVGGDLKWAINSSTTADLTINTDFAQAEADVQVNNVSRFSALFPEKRQFFLENASLFGPGLVSETNAVGSMQMLPFFSRRIGLSDNGTPLPIDAGLRLTHRSTKQNVGFMTARQGSVDTVAVVDYAIGRYSRNFGKQNRLGLIGTMKSVSGGHVNIVGGVDGFLRFNASHSLNFMALQSTNSNGSGSGMGGFVQYYYTTNKVKAWLTETIFTEKFNPELGFLSRSNVIGTAPGLVANLRGSHLPLKKFIRSYQPGVSSSWFHQASTRKLVERELKLTPFWIEMQDGGYYGFSISSIFQNLLSDFQPLGVLIESGEYNYHRLSFSAGSDPSRKISYTLQYDFGDYYNGSLQTTDVSMSIIPIANITLKASVNINDFTSVGSDLESKTVSLYTIQGRFALNPRLQLTGLYQKTSQGNVDSFNIRFAWEYKPLSYIYLVFNSRESLGTTDVNQLERQGIIKINFLKQF